mmetsp:Transcript_50258/g.144858  ORF Transcript_50258/g.144858 Transcript_50258/m.144858 type:complete len:228 (-) Transcript_50258:293-976(-)
MVESPNASRCTGKASADIQPTLFNSDTSARKSSSDRSSSGSQASTQGVSRTARLTKSRSAHNSGAACSNAATSWQPARNAMSGSACSSPVANLSAWPEMPTACETKPRSAHSCGGACSSTTAPLVRAARRTIAGSSRSARAARGKRRPLMETAWRTKPWEDQSDKSTKSMVSPWIAKASSMRSGSASSSMAAKRRQAGSTRIARRTTSRLERIRSGAPPSARGSDST